MSLEQILMEIRLLPSSERRKLVSLIEAEFGPSEQLDNEASRKAHNILEFRGVARRLADDEDPQDYVSRLRDEWD